MFFLFYRWITIFLLIIQHLIYFSDSFKWYIDELCTVRISSSCDGVNEKEGSLFLTFPHLCWGGVKNIKNAINLDLWNVCYNLIFRSSSAPSMIWRDHHFWVRWSTRRSKTWIPWLNEIPGSVEVKWCKLRLNHSLQFLSVYAWHIVFYIIIR